jgi:hypothetical protein
MTNSRQRLNGRTEKRVTRRRSISVTKTSTIDGHTKMFQDTPYWDEEHLLAVSYAMRLAGGRLTIRELRARSGLGENAYRAIIRLVARGDLPPERDDVLLDDNAFVVWSKSE